MKIRLFTALLNSNEKKAHYKTVLLRIPNGKRIWFWYDTAEVEAADANYFRICKQYKNYAYYQQSGPISQIVWTD